MPHSLRAPRCGTPCAAATRTTPAPPHPLVKPVTCVSSTASQPLPPPTSTPAPPLLPDSLNDKFRYTVVPRMFACLVWRYEWLKQNLCSDHPLWHSKVEASGKLLECRRRRPAASSDYSSSDSFSESEPGEPDWDEKSMSRLKLCSSINTSVTTRLTVVSHKSPEKAFRTSALQFSF